MSSPHNDFSTQQRLTQIKLNQIGDPRIDRPTVLGRHSCTAWLALLAAEFLLNVALSTFLIVYFGER